MEATAVGFECGVLCIDWNNRSIEIQGLTGRSVGATSVGEVSKLLHDHANAVDRGESMSVEKMAIVLWPSDEQNDSQLSLYSSEQFKEAVGVSRLVGRGSSWANLG